MHMGSFIRPIGKALEFATPAGSACAECRGTYENRHPDGPMPIQIVQEEGVFTVAYHTELSYIMPGVGRCITAKSLRTASSSSDAGYPINEEGTLDELHGGESGVQT